MKILIVVDMQNDFIDGSLGTKEAVGIVPSVIQEIRLGNYDRIFATLDTHPADYLQTFEGKHLPVAHCIQGTDGWQINAQVKQALEEKHAVYIEKPTFGSQELVHQAVSLHPDEITLIGLCTDICVISNALLLRAALPQIPIHVRSNACAGVSQDKHEAALLVMQSCQIDVQ